VLAIAVLCLGFVVAAGVSLVDYLTAGKLPGDFADLLGILLFGVPLALVIGGLNARAFLLEIRQLRPGGTDGQIWTNRPEVSRATELR
jgi:hypothetical protein